MKHTKILYIVIVVSSLILSCSKNDDISTTDIPNSVRFNFLTNSNNEPLEYPEVSSSIIPTSTYTYTSIKTLKVPVTLTSYTLESPVLVEYSITTNNGNSDAFPISPANLVSFQDNQLTDTIYVDFNERWTAEQSIVLKLETVSDSSINLGNLNSNAPNTSLTINLGDINTSYTFPNNRIEITGEAGEKIEFELNFPNGYIPSEIESTPVFEFLNGFDYDLTTDYSKSDGTTITYKITLNEDIQNDDVYYETIINLIDSQYYNATGNTKLQIVKPIKTPRDLSLSTANNFYDVTNPFYRTYLEHWNDFNNDGVCAWQTTFAFTYPIIVDATNENAILVDNNNTDDPLDDIYHHAFQIGFNSPIANTTTNSFNLKRYFGNESTDRVNSPGFNVTPALEFFPENGTSATNGIVLIIPQFLNIAGINDKSYSFAISGEGTYQEISTGVFEVKFQLHITNEEVFGGTITSDYYLYNTNNYIDPENLTTNNCVTEYTL